MLTYATRCASCVYNCKPWPRRQACVHRHTPSTLKEEPSRPAFQDSHSLASSSHPSTHLTPAWPPSCFFLSLLRMLPLPPSQSNPIYPGRPSSNAINLTRSPQIFPAHFLPCSELKWQVAMDHTFVTHFELLSFNLSWLQTICKYMEGRAYALISISHTAQHSVTEARDTPGPLKGWDIKIQVNPMIQQTQE